MEGFSWNFSTRKKRTTSWYMYSTIFILGLSIWGFFYGYVLMGVVLILFFWVYMLIENNSDTACPVIINPDGIYLNGVQYPFEKIAKFWILSREKKDYIRISIKNIASMGSLSFPVDENLSSSEIKKFLKDFVEYEENMRFPFYEKVAHFFQI